MHYVISVLFEFEVLLRSRLPDLALESIRTGCLMVWSEMLHI